MLRVCVCVFATFLRVNPIQKVAEGFHVRWQRPGQRSRVSSRHRLSFGRRKANHNVHQVRCAVILDRVA